jgi:type IV pilus assembly protein PilQ
MYVPRLARVQCGALAALMLLCARFAHAEGALNHVQEVRTQQTTAERKTELEIVGSRAPSFSARVESGGLRLVVDLSDADVATITEPLSESVGVVGGVLTQAFKTAAGATTRVTINLRETAAYRIKAEGNSLRVVLVPNATTMVDDSARTLPKAKPTAAAPIAALAVPAPGGAASGTAANTAANTEVEDVRFERTRGAEAEDHVIVRLSQVPGYGISVTPQGRTRLELRKTKLPANLVRTLDLAAYHGNLRSVTAFYDVVTGSTVLELDSANEARGSLAVDGKELVWSFVAPRLQRAAVNNGHVPPSGRKVLTVAREHQAEGIPRVVDSILDDGTGPARPPAEAEAGSAEAGFTTHVAAQAVGRYTGQRINPDLKDADIHNVLRLLADVGKVNIITSDDVTGSVTLRMRNVPWDQVLDVVLQAKGLGMVRQGNLIRVAPMAALQKERELRLAAAKQEYELTPLETRLIPVSYATADELAARAKDLLSPRGSVAVDERTNVLITRDITANLNFIEELVRSLDTQTPQVLVEARIVEATSRYIRDIGIQWGGDATFAEGTGNPTGLSFPSSAAFSGGNYDTNTPTAGINPTQQRVATPNFAVNLPAAVGTGAGGALGFALGSIDKNFNINVRLSAAEASGMVRIVSSPRILTLDNRQARISQGTLLPFSQIGAQGVQTTFQEAKLQLDVKPHVTADGSISMHVKVNRDEPDFNQTSARGDPTILKREAETDLLVQDGHTAVIGGIYTRNTGRNLDQVPFFGDLPILGVLFQRRRASDVRNELVIFLTPRIVNRAEALGR